MSKIIVIGPAHLHIINFIDLIHQYFNEIIYVGDDEIDSPHVSKTYFAEFRTLNPILLRKNYHKLKEIIRVEKPDVVHSQQLTRLAYFTAKAVSKTDIPYVLTAWGSDVLIVPDQSPIKRFIVKKTLDRASAITADSLEMVEAIEKLTNCENIVEVLFGIDPISPGEKEKIIYSNRQHKKLYNIDQIINDFFVFQKDHPDWRLLIAADGPLRPELEELVVQLGIKNKVDFLGWLDNKANRLNYKKAAVFMSIPSRDGTAVSLLEAMSAGCIPIVPDLKVSHEWIQDEVNGIIKKAGEKNVINRALALDQQNVIDKNVSLINKKATKKVASQAYLKIYEKLHVFSTD